MYSQEEWDNYQQELPRYESCPWCGKHHNDSYGNQEQPVFHQDLAYCTNCYSQLEANAML